jgi:hypothetical protein
MKHELFLYGTSACHLCEQAEALLGPLLPSAGLALKPVDISDDEDLLERYGLRIPVAAGQMPNGEWLELGWPFDQTQAWTLCARLAGLPLP